MRAGYKVYRSRRRKAPCPIASDYVLESSQPLPNGSTYVQLVLRTGRRAKHRDERGRGGSMRSCNPPQRPFPMHRTVNSTLSSDVCLTAVKRVRQCLTAFSGYSV